jgi:hypothetical protein
MSNDETALWFIREFYCRSKTEQFTWMDLTDAERDVTRLENDIE